MFEQQDLIVLSPGVPADLAAARRRTLKRNSRLERNRTRLALPARPPHRHHRLKWQNHHDFTHRPHPQMGRHLDSSRRQYRHAADLTRRINDRIHIHSSGSKQLPTRNHRSLPPRYRVTAKSDPRSSRSPSFTRRIRPRQTAHFRKSTRARHRHPQRRRSRSSPARPHQARRLLVQPPKARFRRRLPPRRANHRPRSRRRRNHPTPRRNSSPRRPQRRKCSGRQHRHLARRRRARCHRRRHPHISRRRASHRVRSGSARRKVLQRFESHQRRRHPKSHRRVRFAAADHPGRPRQRQPVHAAARASPSPHARRISNRRSSRKNCRRPRWRGPVGPRRNARARRSASLRTSQARRHDSSRARLLEFRSIRKLRRPRPQIQATRRRTRPNITTAKPPRAPQARLISEETEITCPEYYNPIANFSE